MKSRPGARALGRARALGEALRSRLARGLEGSARRSGGDPAYAGPEPLPETLLQRFEVPAEPPRAGIEREARAGGVVRVRARLPALDGDGPARFEWFRPDGGERPRAGLLVFPVLGGPYLYTRSLAAHLARRGFEVVMPHRIAAFLDPGQDGSDLEAIGRASVRGARRLVAWLAARPGVAYDRIGTIGMSLGGLLNTILLAVEPRIAAGVLGVAGGDVAEIVLHSSEPRVVRYRRHRLLRERLTREEIRWDISRRLDMEPLAFARHVDARRVLWVTATRDRVVPRRCNEALWRAIGRPERITLRLGHYSTFLAIHVLRDVFGDFFEARLVGPR